MVKIRLDLCSSLFFFIIICGGSMQIIFDKLNKLSDLEYRDFSARSIPNIDKENIIGVRLPEIRKLAKEIKDCDYIADFLKELPHKYQEEYLLHGIILSTYKDIDKLLSELDIFLEYADNWAVTDIISPKLFTKYPDKVYKYIKKWNKSKYEKKMRCGIIG